MKTALTTAGRQTIDIAWKTFQEGLTKIVIMIQEVTDKVDGAEKKAAALKSLELFFDNVIIAVDLPLIPNIIEPAIDAFTKKLFMSLASGSIDATVATLKTITVFLKERQDVTIIEY